MTRLRSLDVLRGATVAGMILVNNPGSWGRIHGPLRHAEWHGWTVTDLVFPFFLFIAGVSLELSMERRKGSGICGQGMRLVLRSLFLVLIGVAIHSAPRWSGAADGVVWPEFERIRWPGVLQRIGVCVLIAGCARLWLKEWGQWALVLVLCAIWGLVMYGMAPHPGDPLGQADNAAAVVDRAVFGAAHLWIKDPGFDPEGLVSTLTAVATVLIGLGVGRVFVAEGEGEGPSRIGKLAVLGSGLLAVGLVMAQWLPINKALWTPSYVFFSAGLGTLALAGMYWLVDALQIKRPFYAFEALGRNALVLFVGSAVLARGLSMIRMDSGEATVGFKTWLYREIKGWFVEEANASLAIALLHVALFVAIAVVLHRKKIYLRL